ncbi:MAG: hypothetical protein JW967_00225 [Dehalococcoidales bacterium]|nr:hypothetical protein [Dehalococcoidales bacterium]
MSKFIEKLKNRTQISPAPLGFGKVPVQEKPGILLAASITDAGMKNLTDCVSGADAVFLISDSIGSLLNTLPKLKDEVPDMLWGGWLQKAQTEKADAKNMIADFLAFSPETIIFETPAKVGRILEIDESISDTQIRAIDDLPVEAVLFTPRPYSINWQYLIALQRLDNLLAKPLLAAVPSDINVTGLQILWSAGVDGVVIEGGESGKFRTLRQEIDKIIFPLPRKSKKVDVMLPFINTTPTQESDEEEDE